MKYEVLELPHLHIYPLIYPDIWLKPPVRNRAGCSHTGRPGTAHVHTAANHSPVFLRHSSSSLSGLVFKLTWAGVAGRLSDIGSQLSTGWCFEPESQSFEIRAGEERERGGKMMATLSLTGTVTSWQQTVGMRRRTVGVLHSAFCFSSVGVKRRIMQNI